jgi:hypothetical protein
MVAAGATSTYTASAATPATAGDEPGSPYRITLATDPATTDYDHRRADVTGTLTTADGTPVAGVPVKLNEAVVFNTWNPWGDPIDPIYTESTDLGTVQTDADGQFSISSVLVDHTGASSLLNSAHEVDFSATYDVDGDADTWQDTYVGQAAISAGTVSSTLTYHVNKSKVKAGDILTVDGQVTLPRGQEPEGTEVFLRTYYEQEYHAKTTAEDDGGYVLAVKIRNYDNEFVIFSAPRDYYTAGRQYNLPVTNTSL